MDLSLLVGLKNNLAYTRQFYTTTRKLYPDIEIVFVSYGSTDGTEEWLNSLPDTRLKHYCSPENKPLSDTYNKCISLASGKYVSFVHNDMVLAAGFAESIINEISEDSILFYRVIEPPVFANDPHDWKLVKDFGADTDSFDYDAFQSFAGNVEKKTSVPANDLCFFLTAPRSVLIEINGLDPLFNPMFREDDDLLYRLKLYGLKFYQSYSAMVYHFVSKTSRFSADYERRTKDIEENADRNFYRKWGFGIQSRFKRKRKIGLILKNADDKILTMLEPLVHSIYTSTETGPYITAAQPFTSFNLSLKFYGEKHQKRDDILIYFDAKKFSEKNMLKFKNLADEIEYKLTSRWFILKKKLLRNPSFWLGDLKITVVHLKTYEQTLIERK
ncbi:MAG: glycosyltransferase [Niabella sp.]